nr:MFS transporter [Streptomyces sulphureus]
MPFHTPGPSYRRAQPPSARGHLPWLSGHTLLIAQPHRRSRTPRRTGPYARLFTVRGTVAFTLGNLLARLPMGMFSVSAVLMIAERRGSYALAGAVVAAGLAATALVAPLVARLVDRHGQSRVALPATLLAACGSLALVASLRSGAPDWTLFACYAATATTPNTGGMSRARWAHLYRHDASARHSANSLEQALDEGCFTAGPVLAAALCTGLFPEAGTVAGVVLLVVGMVLFTAQRSTEPPVARSRSLRAASPLRLPGMPSLLVVFLAAGAVFGSLEVVTLAFADAQGHPAAGGAVLALQAAGSALAGLAFGSRDWPGTAAARFLPCTAAMATLLALPLVTAAAGGGLVLLGASLLVAGMATAPTMVTGMTLLQERTPAAHLNEGMTLAVTALMGGIAAGSAAGGQAAERADGGHTYAVPWCAALLAAALAWRLRRRSEPPTGLPERPVGDAAHTRGE